MTLPTELEERANAKESRERAGTRAREELARQNHLRPAAPAPDKSDPGGFFQHDPGGFFAAPPTPAPELPPSGLRTAYAQPGDVLPNAQTWEREGVRAEDIGRTALQQGANAFAGSLAMLGGSGIPQEVAQEPIPPGASAHDIALIKENNRINAEDSARRRAAEADAAAEPHAAQVANFVGQIPAYVAAGNIVEGMLPAAPAGAGALPRLARVAHGAARGALENTLVQVPQGGDPSDTLLVGGIFGAAPHAVMEGLGGTEDAAARFLRRPADRAVLHGTGATDADLPTIRRRLGSVEEYADAVRRLRTSGQIPRGATPEQARAVAQQILGDVPGSAQPIMRAETVQAVAANPTVAEHAASPDVAERDQVDRLSDLINEHHDQVASRRGPQRLPIEGPPLEREGGGEAPFDEARARRHFARFRRDPRTAAEWPQERVEARIAEIRAATERRAADTAPGRRRTAAPPVDPLGRTVAVAPQAPETPRWDSEAVRERLRASNEEAANLAANLYEAYVPGARGYRPMPEELDAAAAYQEGIQNPANRGAQNARGEALAETIRATRRAPRPSDMEPLTRALERRGSDIDQAAREAINALVERRAGLQGEELRNFQAADEIRRLGERSPRGRQIEGLEVPQGNPLNARYYLGRLIPRAANRVLNSAFIDDLLTRVIRRGVHEQPGGHTPARHALSAVLTAYHQSGDRRGAAEHHRQVQTDPYYRDLTRRKSRE